MGSSLANVILAARPACANNSGQARPSIVRRWDVKSVREPGGRVGALMMLTAEIRSSSLNSSSGPSGAPLSAPAGC